MATGLRSDAYASAPTLKASSGIAPPPANGSTTKGLVVFDRPSASCELWVKEFAVSRYAGTVELFQSEKSAIKSKSADRSTVLSLSLGGDFWIEMNRE